MKNITIDYLLRQWSLELAMYNRRKAIYDSHSRIYKFFHDLKEPRHPGYRSFRLVDGAYTCIELAFLDKPYLKCNDSSNHGYKLDIITGEKSPCLGSRGTMVSDHCESLMKSYSKEILEILQPYINNIK